MHKNLQKHNAHRLYLMEPVGFGVLNVFIVLRTIHAKLQVTIFIFSQSSHLSVYISTCYTALSNLYALFFVLLTMYKLTV